MRNRMIAAAVAAALGSGAGVASAAGVTAAVAAGQPSIYLAGSSAAASGVLGFIEGTVCGAGNWTEWDTDTSTAGWPDFRVVACSTTAGLPAVNNSAATTFYYRPEGGSVIGVYAVYNKAAVGQINLTAQAAGYTNPSTGTHFQCDQNAAATGGVKLVCNPTNSYIQQTSNTVGASDGWNTAPSFGSGGGAAVAVKSFIPDVGFSDLEPTAFGDAASATPGPGNGNNDPVNYGLFGAIYNFVGPSITTDNLANLAATPIFQQTFGFVVSSNLALTDLPKQSLAAIFSNDSAVLNGAGQPDWSKVNLGNGNKAVAAATPIVVCNREVGSGSRAALDLYLTEDGCNSLASSGVLYDYALAGVAGEPADNFATSLELDCVNKVSNAIGYVSVDNYGKIGNTYANIKQISVDYVAANNLNSAVGIYDFWYEAYITENSTASAIGKNFYTAAIPKLQAIGTTTSSAQVNAIPGTAGNTVSYPPVLTGKDYVSDFTRGGNSCSVPAKK
jgi:hypothetical protein